MSFNYFRQHYLSGLRLLFISVLAFLIDPVANESLNHRENAFW